MPKVGGQDSASIHTYIQLILGHQCATLNGINIKYCACLISSCQWLPLAHTHTQARKSICYTHTEIEREREREYLNVKDDIYVTNSCQTLRAHTTKYLHSYIARTHRQHKTIYSMTGKQHSAHTQIARIPLEWLYMLTNWNSLWLTTTTIAKKKQSWKKQKQKQFSSNYIWW